MIPWLSVIGIGEDGVAGLDAKALALIERAELLVGGARHLAMIGPSRSTAPHLMWQQPLGDTITQILSRRGTPVAVLASGDPMHYGVGATLVRHLAMARVALDEMIVLPRPGAFSLAAARLGWALQDTRLVSLHGRPIDVLARFVAPAQHILMLTDDGGAPARIAEWLSDRGWGDSVVTVLERLGGEREAVWTGLARLVAGRFDDLNIVALDCPADAPIPALSGLAGLPDNAFIHDGQLTKREIRAATLAALAPLPGEILWDLGAGCGSIAIEWLRSAPAMRARAVEEVPARCAMIRQNASSLGVPELEVVQARAPVDWADWPAPHAIFIGGGIEEGLFNRAWEALNPGGRIVANVVSLEGERIVLAARQRYGGHIGRIAITRAEPLGDHLVWRPALPVTQYYVAKPR